jgi:hypothetical protein
VSLPIHCFLPHFLKSLSNFPISRVRLHVSCQWSHRVVLCFLFCHGSVGMEKGHAAIWAFESNDVCIGYLAASLYKFDDSSNRTTSDFVAILY